MAQIKLRALALAAMGVLSSVVSASSNAQPPQIAGVQVRLFYQFSGRFSEPLDGEGLLWNVPAGGSELPEPASSAFVDVTVSGRLNTYAGIRNVKLLVKDKATGKVLERQSSRLGIFGPAGETHVGFWLRSVGCEPLTLVVSVAGDSQSKSIPFRCGE